MFFLDTESKLKISSMYKVFEKCLLLPQVWCEIEWHGKMFPEVLIEVVRRAGKNVQSFSCGSKSEKEPFTMDLNKVIGNLHNLRYLTLSQCTLVYNWGFLSNTTLITHMYVDKCLADPNSMIAGINSLINLRHLQITRCSLMSAYNLCQAVKYCLKLEFLDVRGSGRMKSVLACVVLNKCVSLKTFFFSNLYTYDTMYDRLRWYRIAKMKFKHVNFDADLYERVAFYTRTDLAVRQLLNIGQMLDKFGPREE